MMAPDLHIGLLESFWPTSAIGWLTAGTLATAVGKTAYDWLTGRRKSLAVLDKKLDGLCEQINDMEGELKVVDGLGQSVRDLVYEWRGLDGNNGYKSIIKSNQERIRLIEKRNDKIDAVREEDERRGGGQHRRLMDRELNNLLPEEREDQG